MKTELQHIKLKNFKTNSGKTYTIPLSYELFGKNLGDAPLILVNHAFTGNSNVCGAKGWWKAIIGDDKVIDTKKFTILAINIPGNGYDDFFIENYQDFVLQDYARIFLKGLEVLKISKLHCIIGGSIGGALGWEMLALQPNLSEIFIPIATDYKTTDWLHSQCLVQKFLLESDKAPLEKARIHAMLCYRTPESINLRFNNEIHPQKEILKSHDWLNYHGKSLTERFSLKAYQLMNHLLMNINTDEHLITKINAKIHLISIDKDLFFPAFEIKKCYENLLKNNRNTYYHEMKSIHGHDAFLMEYQQLEKILETII